MRNSQCSANMTTQAKRGNTSAIDPPEHLTKRSRSDPSNCLPSETIPQNGQHAQPSTQIQSMPQDSARTTVRAQVSTQSTLQRQATLDPHVRNSAIRTHMANMDPKPMPRIDLPSPSRHWVKYLEDIKEQKELRRKRLGQNKVETIDNFMRRFPLD